MRLIMCVCSDCIDYNSILASKSLWAVGSEQLLKSLSFLSKTLSSVVISFNFTMTQLLHQVFLKVSCKCREISQFLVMFKIIEFFKANEMKISVPYFLWYLIHFEQSLIIMRVILRLQLKRMTNYLLIQSFSWSIISLVLQVVSLPEGLALFLSECVDLLSCYMKLLNSQKKKKKKKQLYRRNKLVLHIMHKLWIG